MEGKGNTLKIQVSLVCSLKWLSEKALTETEGATDGGEEETGNLYQSGIYIEMSVLWCIVFFKRFLTNKMQFAILEKIKMKTVYYCQNNENPAPKIWICKMAKSKD